MHRCLDIAALGAGSVAPNPMVGSVIVHNGKIIGEGFHQKYGGPHAEVNAIHSVNDHKLLKESTLYVNLEPCSHHGLTPPCSDLIINKKIPRVVIGTIDPFAKVAGRGIEKMTKSGIQVETGILKSKCLDLNKRFFTFHNKNRPYIILKWAQTIDGYLDIERSTEDYGEPTWITGDTAMRLVHKIRSEEDAILVGTKTAKKDNPTLTVRHWSGRNPLRLLIDRNLSLPENINLLQQSSKTLVFNTIKNSQNNSVSFIKINFEDSVCRQVLDELYNRKILSLIVEGGKYTIDSFIKENLWDEAHIFIGNKFFFSGVSAPSVKGNLTGEENFDKDCLKIFHNNR